MRDRCKHGNRRGRCRHACDFNPEWAAMIEGLTQGEPAGMHPGPERGEGPRERSGAEVE